VRKTGPETGTWTAIRDGSPGSPLSFYETLEQGGKARHVFDFFTGEDDLKIDPKGRVTIPHRIRRVVERGDPDWSEGKRPTLFLVYGHETWNRLEAFSVRNYTRTVNRIRKLPGTHPDRAFLLAQYTTHALETQIDEEGRITIPQRHRDRLKLERDLYLSSKLDHFRLWRREDYDATEGAALADWAQARGPAFDLDTILPDDDED
jgi:MraZ protein